MWRVTGHVTFFRLQVQQLIIHPYGAGNNQCLQFSPVAKPGPKPYVGKSVTFHHFFSSFYQFLSFFLIFFLVLDLHVDNSPTQEGPGYATGWPQLIEGRCYYVIMYMPARYCEIFKTLIYNCITLAHGC